MSRQEEIDRLRSSAARQTSVVGGVIAFVQGIIQQIRDGADDPTEIRELADEMEANTDRLAQAIAISTDASDEVHMDDGGTGDGSTAVDPETAVEADESEGSEETDSSSSDTAASGEGTADTGQADDSGAAPADTSSPDSSADTSGNEGGESEGDSGNAAA